MAATPHEASYRFAGREIGGVGNNGTVETDYQSSINNRATTPGNGAFRGGSGNATTWADFGRQIQPYTSFAQGEAGGVYTVRDGDSLHSIAAALWGDSALWYHLAEANGLSAGSALVPGQTLTLPAGIQRSSNSASTFKPYDPAAAIGDVSPGSPTPKKNKCGVIGAILVAVVAIAVTVAVGGATVALLSKGMTFMQGVGAFIGVGGAAGAAGASLPSGGALFAGGVIGAMAGGLASQGVRLKNALRASKGIGDWDPDLMELRACYAVECSQPAGLSESGATILNPRGRLGSGPASCHNTPCAHLCSILCSAAKGRPVRRRCLIASTRASASTPASANAAPCPQ